MLSTLDLLKKYDVPGPRYTSYPTVPAWTESVGGQAYAKALAAVAPDETLSLYFHLPFCEKLCHFCGCFKIITPDHSRSAPYVALLLQELDLVRVHLKNSECKVSQIHFGGGTPNFIQPEEMSLIMRRVRENFNVLPGAEVAIEMHPRTSTKEFCDNLKREGFNRISLGVQDFDEEVQKLINRHQSFEMTREMVASLRGLGFGSFNFDLIYGLPGQTLKKFEKTLDLTFTLKPERLAVYSYAHVPWKSPVQRSFKDQDLPSAETKLKLYELALKAFSENGYYQVGMDHFALATDELYLALERGGLHRNFMGYSTKADAHQIGIGISSISYVSGNYFQNAKEMGAYEGAIREGRFTTIRGYELSADDHIRRDLITEIMCHFGVNFDVFGKKHGINARDYFHNDLCLLADLEADGLVIIDGQGLSITGPGRLVVRNVAMCFDRYLDEIRRTSKNPVFSRTV